MLVLYHDSPGSGCEFASVGAARIPDMGGSLLNLSIRSSCILYAFISAKPVLCVPTIFDANDDIILRLFTVWHWGHDVSSGLVLIDCISSKL